MKEQIFVCERQGLKIRGMQCMPENFEEDKKYPAMIASHGFTGNYTNMVEYCREFARLGYAAFCFSFCGGGCLYDEENLKSDGQTTEMTILTEIEDLIAVKNYVQALPFVDAENLVLLGASQGGFVSGLVAARSGDEIKKLIMIYPALCIPDHARRGCLGGASYDVKKVPEKIDCGRSILGKKFHDTVVSMDPYLELAAYQGQVLLVHGLEDKTVNYSYSVQAKESYQKGQCHLQLIRGMGHSCEGMQLESVLASIRQFLLGRKEILTIQVFITDTKENIKDEIKKVSVLFTGYCDTEYFKGAIIPEGCDEQEYCQNVQTKIRAEYTLKGIDCDGKVCSIHIINQRGGKEWKPVIKTDSEGLSWLNEADLTATLEYGVGKLTVRIFADR